MQVVQITAATPSKTFQVTSELDRDNLVRFGTLLTGNNYAAQTVALHVQNPQTLAWYDTGISFTTNFAAVIQMKTGLNYRLIAPTAVGLDVSVMFY
jgi:hypothetical protein